MKNLTNDCCIICYPFSSQGNNRLKNNFSFTAVYMLNTPTKINKKLDAHLIFGAAALSRVIRVCFDPATNAETSNINPPIVRENTPNAPRAVVNPPDERAKIIKPAKMGPVQPIPAALYPKP